MNIADLGYKYSAHSSIYAAEEEELQQPKNDNSYEEEWHNKSIANPDLYWCKCPKCADKNKIDNKTGKHKRKYVWKNPSRNQGSGYSSFNSNSNSNINNETIEVKQKTLDSHFKTEFRSPSN